MADLMIAMSVGETPGQTYKEAQQTIDRSLQAQQRMLDEKIQRYRKEKRDVYGM